MQKRLAMPTKTRARSACPLPLRPPVAEARREPAEPGIVMEPDFPMPRTLADLAAERQAFLATVPVNFVEEDGLPPVLLSEG